MDMRERERWDRMVTSSLSPLNLHVFMSTAIALDVLSKEKPHSPRDQMQVHPTLGKCALGSEDLKGHCYPLVTHTQINFPEKGLTRLI